MSQSPTTHVLNLPVTVDVSPSGGITVESGSRFTAMSRFTERAQREAQSLGHGVHVITDANVADVADVTVYDLAEALS